MEIELQQPNYTEIGERIREIRLRLGWSQEQLAEQCGLSKTHMSHIETGNTVPSLRIFIDLINILGCSADELLCIEIKKSRPVFLRWLDDLLADCNSQELKIISETVRTLKVSLREFGFSYRWDR